MERKPPPKILQLKAVRITLPFILSTKTPGPPRRARGLPSFIYMISVMAMSLLFYYSTWHRVRPVGPEARRLLLYAISCNRTSSVSAPKNFSCQKPQFPERLYGGQGLQNNAHMKNG